MARSRHVDKQNKVKIKVPTARLISGPWPQAPGGAEQRGLLIRLLPLCELLKAFL